MNTFVGKVASLLPALEAHGAVYLFALVEREDINRWDVVISSVWSDGDWAVAVRTVVALLKPQLTPEEITLISRVGVISSGDPRVQEIPESLDGVVPESNRSISVPLFGAEVRRAFIFKAQRPSSTLPLEPLAGAAV